MQKIEKQLIPSLRCGTGDILMYIFNLLFILHAIVWWKGYDCENGMNIYLIIIYILDIIRRIFRHAIFIKTNNNVEYNKALFAGVYYFITLAMFVLLVIVSFFYSKLPSWEICRTKLLMMFI